MKKKNLILEGYLRFHWTQSLRNKEETQAKASPTQREHRFYTEHCFKAQCVTFTEIYWHEMDRKYVCMFLFQ